MKGDSEFKNTSQPLKFKDLAAGDTKETRIDILPFTRLKIERTTQISPFKGIYGVKECLRSEVTFNDELQNLFAEYVKTDSENLVALAEALELYELIVDSSELDTFDVAELRHERNYCQKISNGLFAHDINDVILINETYGLSRLLYCYPDSYINFEQLSRDAIGGFVKLQSKSEQRKLIRLSESINAINSSIQ